MININSIQKEKSIDVGFDDINQNLNTTQKIFNEFLNKHEKSKTEISVLEFSNYIDSLEKEKLNGQNGYYSKTGFDAIDKNTSCAKKVYEEILDLVNKKQRELKLKEGYGLKIAEATKTKKLNTILKGIISHEMNETLNWELRVIEDAKLNAINKGVLYRENNNDLLVALQNGITVILYKGKLMELKKEEIKGELLKFESDFHSNIIMAFSKEKSLKAKKYFEEHKEKLLPENKEKLEKIVNEVEKNFKIDEISNSLFNLYSNDNKTLEKKLDEVRENKEEVKNKVLSLVNLKNQKEESLQDDILKNFFDMVQKKQKEDDILDLKDIPIGLNLENQLSAKKYIEKINKNGFIESNDFIFLNLFERLDHPEKFKNLKLQKYRFYLSQEDFNIFSNLKTESSIKLKDEFELLNKAGDKLKDKSEKADFIRKIINDFEEGKNSKGKSLTFEEKQKAINARLNTK